MKRSKTRDMFLRTVNIILVMLIFIIGILLFIFAIENESDIVASKTQSVLFQSKKETMLSNTIIKQNKDFKSNGLIEEKKVVEKIDPDMEYAIKLFESDLNKKLKKHFKKPFNYKLNSYCLVEFKLDKMTYSFKTCNSDSIFKRELDLAIEKQMPLKRFTYNKINLKKKQKKLTITLNID